MAIRTLRCCTVRSVVATKTDDVPIEQVHARHHAILDLMVATKAGPWPLELVEYSHAAMADAYDATACAEPDAGTLL